MAHSRGRIVAMLLPLALTAIATLTLTLAPARAQSVVRYASSAEPRTLDSVVNWLSVTHQHSYLVYDNLFSLNDDFKPTPQMVERVEKNADGTTTTMTLRAGLAFHDGAPVTSSDVVASIRRWAARDPAGRKLVEMHMKLATIDPATFSVTLDVDTSLLVDAMAKPTATGLFVLRERDAATDPMTAVKEIVGSGPFRFNPAQYSPGAKLVYERNAAYRPRPEPASYLAGGKTPRVDRVEWLVMPDSATAVAALQKGELDIYETPPLDLLPLLQGRPDIVVAVHSKYGQIGFLRPNFKQPPFDRPEARRALAMAIDQADFMAVAAGADGRFWHRCYGFLGCGGANESQVSTDWMRQKKLDEARRLFQAAGYDGRPVVIIAPGDNEVIKSFGTMAADALRGAGVNVDIQYMDFATMMTRRNKQDPTAQGGWNIFPMWSYGFELDNPMGNVGLSTACNDGAYAGWACDPKIEMLKDRWARESDPQIRRAIIDEIQTEAASLVPIVPLGQFFAPVAYRKSITGFLQTPLPVFWNLEKK